MDSFYYSGAPTNLADTASLPRRPRGTPWPTFPTPPCEGPMWRPELCTTARTPEAYPTYGESSHISWPAYGAPDRTAELLAKQLSGSEDPDVTALSEAVRVKLGITEPLTKPEMVSPSPGLMSLAHAIKRSRVSGLLPKGTCPSPFHPHARTVPIAELQDVPVTEAGEERTNGFGPTRWQTNPPFRSNLRGSEEWQADRPGEHPARTAGVRPKKSAPMVRRSCSISST